MKARGRSLAALVSVLLVTVALSGCLTEEEKKSKPEPKVVMTGPNEAWVGDLVVFDAQGTKDDETKLEALDFEWAMGDGTVYKGKPFVSMWIVAPNHTFQHEGTYNVSLTVTDVWGNAGVANRTIFVRYQLNMTVNSRGTWLSEDALNNTTYFNLTVRNVWTERFDVPLVRIRMLNETAAEVAPRAQAGDTVPSNLTAGQSFTVQVHFTVPEGFNVTSLHVTDELRLDLA